MLYGFIFQFFFLSILLAENGKSQRKSISKIPLALEFKNTNLKNVFDKITEVTDFEFAFNDARVDLNARVSTLTENKSLRGLLEKLSRDYKLKFKRVNENIVVSKRLFMSAAIEEIIDDEEVASIIIQGTVTSSDDNLPLPGVTVVAKGTTTGTTTDNDGRYNIEVEDGTQTLVFSYVGFVSEEIDIAGRSVIDVSLAPDVLSLQELVVIGYGTQEKKDVTGALSTIEGAALTVAPVPNLSGALAGKVTGVLSIQPSGQPGFDEAQFQIRGRSTTGNSNPLILVDGVVRPFSRVNPHEIESVTVLKDAASTAVYGSRAANGVLLITTRRGEIGKPSFNFSTRVSRQSPIDRPDLMDANQYVLSFREALANEGTPPDQLPFADRLADAQNGTLESFDWWESTLTNSAPMQQYNFSVSGGTDIVKYFFSYGLLDQEGFMENATYKQNSIRSNIDVQLTDRLTFGLDLAGRLEDRLRSADGDGEIFSNALRANPLFPVFLDGRPGAEDLPPGSLGFDGFSGNSFGDANRNGTNTRDNDLFQSNIRLTYDIPWIKGLKASGLYSYDRTNTRTRIFFTPYTTYQQNEATGEFIRLISDNNRTLDETRSNLTQQTVQLSFNYEKDWADHHISALALFEQIETNFDQLTAFRDGFISPVIEQFFAGSVENDQNNGTALETARRGYVARVNYGFRNKYLFQANLRIDQSFAFPSDEREGYFPAFSAGWRISEEPFMSNIDFISNLKARASWGIIGNDRVDPFQFLAGFAFGGGYIQDGALQLGIQPTVIPNPNITWETAKATDIGIEAGFLDGKLELEMDYYFKRTDNILASRSLSVPQTFGATLPDENLAIVDSWGWEALVSHSNNIGELAYEVSANVTIAKNEIVFLDEPADVLPSASLTGKEIGVRVGFLSDGLYQSQEEINNGPTQFGALAPGDIRYKDINGRDAEGNLTGLPDGQINQDDRSVIGSSNTPNLIYGINFELGYKGFNFSAKFQGASDYSRRIQPEGFLLGVGNNFAVLEDSWSPTNTDGRYPRILPDGNANNDQSSDFWIEEINFFRLRNVKLSYDFTETLDFFESIGIEELQMFFSASNLVTFTNVTIGDPEGNDGNALFYPLSRTLSFGVNIGF